MTLEKFATYAGCVVQLNVSPEGWGGKWQYFTKEHPNCYFNGFKTKQAAYIGWLRDTFGPTTSRAVLAILKERESPLVKVQ